MCKVYGTNNDQGVTPQEGHARRRSFPLCTIAARNQEFEMLSAIPPRALTSHIAFLGKTGVGKTYGVKGAIVEPLLAEHSRVCIVDPTGVYYGLRLQPDGKTPSRFPIVIFGGRHGDRPISELDGEAIAEAVGTTATPVVIDTSDMRVGERTRFFASFAETLLRVNQGPLHLIIDEAHLFAPQGRVNDPQSGKMLGATNNMVSLGRSRGLRITMVSQRPAKLHKDSLTQCETLIAMRLVAPQDRNAVDEWIGEWGDPAIGKKMIAGLSSLGQRRGHPLGAGSGDRRARSHQVPNDQDL
jgi:DNA helicase HerA-like ATPase